MMVCTYAPDRMVKRLNQMGAFKISVRFLYPEEGNRFVGNCHREVSDIVVIVCGQEAVHIVGQDTKDSVFLYFFGGSAPISPWTGYGRRRDLSGRW